ncbi:MAG TPA: TIGR00341 family protein [Streptosporangiaceae bacterium]|nr:TIGR00341 family protein [Streptosporangiaceae bacterium]
MSEENDERAVNRSASLLGRVAGIRRTLPELRETLFLDIGDVRAKMSRFWILLMLSAVIAATGILADSTATVIGAMIIAPLGTPLMGMALAVVTGGGRRLLRSTALAIGGTITVILVGAFLAWIFPKLQPLADNGQVTGRTSPGVLDLVAAVATGVAGSYGLARRDVSDVMPGVAIAISLVPPLAVVGITAADGYWNEAFGAFVLFAANVMAVIVAGTIVLTLCGYGRDAGVEPGFRRGPAYVVIAMSLLLILVPLVFTTTQAAREQVWLDRALAIARPWAARRHYTLDDVKFEGSQLHVVIEGTGPGPSAAQLLRLLHDRLPAGTAVVLDTVHGSKVLIGHVPA